MRRPLILALVTLPLVLGVGPAAWAHPLGNFTVNRFAEVVVEADRIEVRYVLDLAEIPTFQERQRIDLDGDGLGQEELGTWAARTAATIARRVVLEIEDRRVALRVQASTATVLAGDGGLSTLRLEATFRAPSSSRSGLLRFEDRNDPDRLGWREIVATGMDGVVLVDSTVPSQSTSDRLRSYPEDLLSSPLVVTAMETRFRPGEDPAAAAGPPAPAERSLRPLADGRAFATLIGRGGMPLMLLGVLAAVSLGAWHALLPGHGKTLMAAAMVGSGARTRQAVVAGVSVASMHTISVIALGFLVLGLEHAFHPEAVYPWLQVASGVLAVGFGLHLVRGRWRSWRRDRLHRLAGEPHPLRGHPHVHELPAEGLLSRRGIAVLAVAGGILPSPSALLVLLAAIQGGRVAYGLGLVLAFSTGLAASLVAIGLGVMRARRFADRRPWGSVLRHVVPLCSASAVALIGLFVMGRGAASL